MTARSRADLLRGAIGGDAAEGSMSGAVATLQWFYGTGAATAAGDLGLRSHMATQIEVLQSCSSHRQTDCWGQAERMHRCLDSVGRWRCANDRVGQLGPRHQEVLALSFSVRTMAGRLPAAVILTPSARRRWVTEVEALRVDWLRADPSPTPAKVAELDEQARRWMANRGRLHEAITCADAETRNAAVAEAKQMTDAAVRAFSKTRCGRQCVWCRGSK